MSAKPDGASGEAVGDIRYKGMKNVGLYLMLTVQILLLVLTLLMCFRFESTSFSV